jgi:hypothetical protein
MAPQLARLSESHPHSDLAEGDIENQRHHQEETTAIANTKHEGVQHDQIMTVTDAIAVKVPRIHQVLHSMTKFDDLKVWEAAMDTCSAVHTMLVHWSEFV